MQIISLSEGISVIGNYTLSNIPAADAFRDEHIRVVKTLFKGRWVSWDSQSLDSFLGFAVVESGRGYVVKTDASAEVFLPSANDLNTLDIKVQIGYNLISLPFDNTPVIHTFERFSTILFKTIRNGRWVSNVKDAPVIFNGFSNFNKSLGYVVKVIKVITPLESLPHTDDLEDELPKILTQRFSFETSKVKITPLGLRYSFYTKK